MTTFSIWLSTQRKAAGKSQAELAATLGITQAQLSHLARGTKEPTAAQIKALARAFRVEPPDLAQTDWTAGDGCARRSAFESAHPSNGHAVGGRKPAKTQAIPKPPPGADSPSADHGDKRRKNAHEKARATSDAPTPEAQRDHFKRELWSAADKLRGNMDAGAYKHIVLGLIFLKYISDAFDALRVKLEAQDDCDPEDRAEYLAENVFWVPRAARWGELQAKSKLPSIGELIDDAMIAIEKDNPALKDVLPKDYNKPQLDKRRLGGVLDLLSGVELIAGEHRSRDLLGEVYEYFLGMFAAAEGKRGGEFFTPASIVRTLVECIEPYRGRVYDPCCGSGGMFVQSERFVEEHGGNPDDLSIYGQESNATTWRLCRMNLAIRNIPVNLGTQWGDTFHNDRHPGLEADYILANPPFNDSDWGGDTLANDVRWRYGTPPTGNANYAWLQHIIHHLSPNGVAGVVLANGSMSSQPSGEGELRKALLEADLVDCMIALPGQLFRNTGIPACIWILARNKADRRFRTRKGEVLFIDARKLGTMVDRALREFSDEDTRRISKTYHAYRGEAQAGTYKDVAGFCRAIKLEDISEHQHVLTPGRYVGVEEAEGDDEPFEEKMARLAAKLHQQLTESAELEKVIRGHLRGLGYGD